MRSLLLPAVSLAASTFLLSACNASAAKRDPPSEPAAASAAPAAEDSAWVGRSDGARSCEPKSGKTLEQGAQALESAGIRILESRKGNDGKMYAQMCGGRTGSMNTYRVPRSELSRALDLGYTEVK